MMAKMYGLKKQKGIFSFLHIDGTSTLGTAIKSPEEDTLPVLAMVGMALWLSGFAIESISDYQKRVFRKENNPSEAFIHTGLGQDQGILIILAR